MRRTVLLILWVLVGAPIVAATADTTETNITGLYSCDGMSPEGRPYHGKAEIVRLDDTYRILWSLESNSGDVQMMGVGILRNGVFSVSYFGGAPGIAVYKIDGQKLVGEWTIGGADGAVYPETLTRLADQQPHPSPAPQQQDNRPPPAQKKPASLRPAVAALR